jgi:diguanylate cyclase (GGDEF)-like protein/PAS domain S-box-containing protein
MDHSLKGMQGLGYIAVVPDADVAGFETMRRAEGLRGYQVEPAGRRPFTTAVVYMEPREWHDPRGIGFDRYTLPAHQQAMNWSAITGDPAITSAVSLAPGSSAEKGNVLYRPLFSRGHLAASSEAARLEQVRGWAFMVLRMGPLIRSALAEVDNPDLSGAAVLIYEGTRPIKEALVFDNQQIHGTARLRNPSYSRVQIANLEWLVGVQQSGRHRGGTGLSPDLTLLGFLGGTVSLLAALTCRSLVDNHVAITKALQEAEHANQERALASAVFETSPLAILVTDPEGRIIHTNQAFSTMSGLSRMEARGEKANILKSGRHGEEFYRQMWQELRRTGSWKGELWNRHRSNEIRRDELTIIAVLDHQQTITHYVGMLQDITERHAEQEKVKYQAMHDYLTGLPNRALLMEQLDHHLALARRYQTKVALMFIDLDGFKPVNDLHGHAIGDRLLQLVARRMQQVLRESDVLSRQGGDEYVLLIPEAPAADKLVDIARKLRAAVALPYPELPEILAVSVSIGIACWPEHGSDADSLLDAADAAMYRSKHANPQHIELARAAENSGED